MITGDIFLYSINIDNIHLRRGLLSGKLLQDQYLVILFSETRGTNILGILVD